MILYVFLLLCEFADPENSTFHAKKKLSISSTEVQSVQFWPTFCLNLVAMATPFAAVSHLGFDRK